LARVEMETSGDEDNAMNDSFQLVFLGFRGYQKP
jgi:hypothetical protein